jgi:hypothetical protein
VVGNALHFHLTPVLRHTCITSSEPFEIDFVSQCC